MAEMVPGEFVMLLPPVRVQATFPPTLSCLCFLGHCLRVSPLTQNLGFGIGWGIFLETGSLSSRMTHSPSHLSGLKLLGAPVKLTVSQGQPVKLNCSVEGMEEPEIQWVKDGAVVQSVDQVYIPVSEQHWIGFLRCRTVGEGVGCQPGDTLCSFHGVWELGAMLMPRGLWFFYSATCGDFQKWGQAEPIESAQQSCPP